MTIKNSYVLAGLMTAAMMVAAPVAGADTFHDQSMVDINAFGWDSVGGSADAQQIADDFQLSLDGRITILNWTGKYHDGSVPSAKSFEVRIFGDADGQPGDMIFSQSLPVTASDTGGMDRGAHNLLTYTASLTGSPVLDGQKTYWLSIRESDPSTSVMWSWSFHNRDVAGGYSYRRGDSAPWAIGARDMAYSLSIAPTR